MIQVKAEEFFNAMQEGNEMRRRISLIVSKLISFLNYDLFLKEWVARDPVNGPKEIVREGDYGCRIGFLNGNIMLDFVKFTKSGHEVLFSSHVGNGPILDQHVGEVHRLLTPLINKMIDRFPQHGFAAKVEVMMSAGSKGVSVEPSGWKG